MLLKVYVASTCKQLRHAVNSLNHICPICIILISYKLQKTRQGHFRRRNIRSTIGMVCMSVSYFVGGCGFCFFQPIQSILDVRKIVSLGIRICPAQLVVFSQSRLKASEHLNYETLFCILAGFSHVGTVSVQILCKQTHATHLSAAGTAYITVCSDINYCFALLRVLNLQICRQCWMMV